MGAGSDQGSIPACLSVEAGEVLPPFNAGMYVVDARAPRCEGRSRDLSYLDTVNPGLFTVTFEPGPFDRWVAARARGGGLHWLQWILMISGFAISALIAASLSGLIRRD